MNHMQDTTESELGTALKAAATAQQLQQTKPAVTVAGEAAQVPSTVVTPGTSLVVQPQTPPPLEVVPASPPPLTILGANAIDTSIQFDRDEILPGYSCFVRGRIFEFQPDNVALAIKAGYSEIFVHEHDGIFKHHVLPGTNRFIRTKVKTKLPKQLDLKPTTEVASFLPAGMIPWELLDQIEDLFRTVMARHKSHVEALAWIMWNEAQGYFIHVPNQRVSKASVSYDWTGVPGGSFLIVDMHSHNSMGAFFSGTDDSDDRNGIRYSGVFGHLDKPTAEIKLRFNYLSEKTLITPEAIFSRTRAKSDIPETWLSAIQEAPATTYGTHYGSGGYGNTGIYGTFKGQRGEWRGGRFIPLDDQVAYPTPTDGGGLGHEKKSKPLKRGGKLSKRERRLIEEELRESFGPGITTSTSNGGDGNPGKRLVANVGRRVEKVADGVTVNGKPIGDWLEQEGGLNVKKPQPLGKAPQGSKIIPLGNERATLGEGFTLDCATPPLLELIDPDKLTEVYLDKSLRYGQEAADKFLRRTLNKVRLVHGLDPIPEPTEAAPEEVAEGGEAAEGEEVMADMDFMIQNQIAGDALLEQIYMGEEQEWPPAQDSILSEIPDPSNHAEYTDISMTHGVSVAEPYCLISDLMVTLERKPELLAQLSKEMFSLLPPEEQGKTFREFFDALPRSVRERIETNGL